MSWETNAESGCDREGYERAVGPHGSGADSSRFQRLRISGSPTRWTWYRDTGKVAKKTYCIQASIRWGDLPYCRVYRCVEIWYHIDMVTSGPQKNPPFPGSTPAPFQLDRLRGECARIPSPRQPSGICSFMGLFQARNTRRTGSKVAGDWRPQISIVY